MTIGRDSTGFEDIDEFWDAEVPSPVPLQSDKLASTHLRNRPRSNSDVSMYTELESFDYDTSDSIEEEEEEEEEEETKGPPSDKDTNSMTKPKKNSAIDHNSPRREFRGRSVGGRDSIISNFSLESSLGGTLPLEDSEDEFQIESDTKLKSDQADRYSLDSLYEKRSINEDMERRSSQDIKDGEKKKTGRRSSVSTVRDGARGRLGMTDNDDVDSVDTTDMSAIPSDRFDIDGDNNIETEDENLDFGDDFQDNFDPTGLEEETGKSLNESNRKNYSKKSRQSSIDKKTNRRVSFGEGTKPEIGEEDAEEELAENNDVIDTSDFDDREDKNNETKRKETMKNSKSNSPSRSHTTPARSSTNSSTSSSSSSAGAMYSMGTTPGSNEFARGRVIVDDSFIEDQDESELRNSESDGDSTGEGEEDGGDDADADADISYVQDTSFLKALKSRVERKKEGGQNNYNRRDSRASTDQEDEEEEEEEEEEDKSNGMRRSSRVTKGKRMAYWRGERPVYQKGRMVGMLVADKTPLKPRKLTNLQSKKRKNEKQGLNLRNDDTDSEEEESSRKHNMKRGKRIIDDEDEKIEIFLPTNLTFLKREIADELSIWDDPSEATKTLKVVCHCESLQPPSALPITDSRDSLFVSSSMAVRPAGKERVGYAAQSFNVPEISGVMSGWISGFVELPAGAIKDAEGVGECAQVFFVSECQDDGVELGIADPQEEEWKDDIAQRILLRKGDSFFVPPGNIYRLENHSASTSCTLFWTIVRPMDQNQIPSLPTGNALESKTDFAILSRLTAMLVRINWDNGQCSLSTYSNVGVHVR